MQLSLTGFAIAMLLLAAVTLAVHFRWIRPGRFRMRLVFGTGVLMILALWLGGVPPDWFDGSWEGFGIAIGLLLSGWVADRGEERAFGRPLFLGLGLALLGVNVAALIRNVG